MADSHVQQSSSLMTKLDLVSNLSVAYTIITIIIILSSYDRLIYDSSALTEMKFSFFLQPYNIIFFKFNLVKVKFSDKIICTFKLYICHNQ